MDHLRIPPTDLGAFLTERTERIERTRPDRGRRSLSEPRPKRRREESSELPDESADERGTRIAIDV